MKTYSKTFLFTCFICLAVACTNNPPPVFKEYIDYPPLVVQNHLEQAYDSCKWFLYGTYSTSKCVSWDKGDIVIYITDKGDSLSKCVPKYIDEDAYLTTYSIMLDTLEVKGDTAIFYTYITTRNDNYCVFVKSDEIKNQEQRYLDSCVALSITTDTIIYFANITGKLPKERRQRKARIWGAPFNDNYSKKKRENKLKHSILKDTTNIHPWLHKQASLRGWLNK